MHDFPARVRDRTLPLVAVTLLVFLCAGFIPTAAQAGCTSNDPTAPCLEDNDDILSGQRALLAADDLLVHTWLQPAPTEPRVDNWYLHTQGLTIPNPQTSPNSVAAVCPTAVTPVLDSPLVGVSPTSSGTGRPFSTANDVVMQTVITSNCTQVELRVHDPVNSANDSAVVLDWVGVGQPVFMLVADFDLDGYDDVLILTSNFDFPGSSMARIYTAVCTGDPGDDCSGTQGPANGLAPSARPPLALPEPVKYTTPAVGDFNGDGIKDVVWGVSPFSGSGDPLYVTDLRFASVCPAAGATLFGSDDLCSDPLQIVLPAQGAVGTPHLQSMTLVAGNFDGRVDSTTGRAADELLYAATGCSLGNCTSELVVLSGFDNPANLVPQNAINPLVSFDNLKIGGGVNLQAYLVAGRLRWDADRDQAVWASTFDSSCCDRRGLMSVITFDDNLRGTSHNVSLPQHNAGGNTDQKTRIFGLALGRFDPPNVNGNTDFDQQFAVLVDREPKGTTGNQHTWVYIYDVDTDTFEPSSSPTQQLQLTTTTYYQDAYFQYGALQAGDFQGRSLVLGAPTKVTAALIQPDTILGMPPMHVDFVGLVGGGEPQVVNVSVSPNTFNTAFDFAESGSTQHSTTSTTSYTVATDESFSQKATYGVPKVDFVSVKLKESAKQTHENSTTKSYNTYSGESYDFSAATVFDDKVVATSEQQNIYSYPVIGQMACPQDSPNCPDDCSPGDTPCPMVQLAVQYSAPDNVYHLSGTDGAGLEWYQPVHEPGNVLSYPGNFTLLSATLPQLYDPDTGATTSSLDLLTMANEVWVSQSSDVVTLDWTQGASGSKTTGTTSTNSFDTSVTVKGKATLGDFSGGGSASFDLNLSKSASTLKSSTHTLDESAGVILRRGLQNSETSGDEFAYQGESYVFGQLAPIGTIDTTPVADVGVQSQGYLQVGHVANPLSTGLFQSGAWWKQIYANAPDVALNHPQRWQQSTPQGSISQQVRFNCPIGYTSDFGVPSEDPGACTATAVTPNPQNLALAHFYEIKGLFVLPGSNTDGPPTYIGTLGDSFTLQARIYNYSLVNMPSGTDVHVRFYAQPWDGTNGQFTAGSGAYGFAEAVYIGETLLGPIPAFCGGSDGDDDACNDNLAPTNWLLAQVPWDTSTLNPQPETGTTWKFWVVVWMEDGNGDLVPEIAQHGLAGIPPAELDSLAEVAAETYSNNVGYYNQAVTLELPVASAAPPAQAPVESSLSIDAVEVFPLTVLRDHRVSVRVKHRAGGTDLEQVLALLYAGDPETGGELLDLDIIPRIEANGSFVTPFPYHPGECGRQTLYLRSVAQGGIPPVNKTVSFDVTIDPAAEVGKLKNVVAALELEKPVRVQLQAMLDQAGRAFERGRTGQGLHHLEVFARHVLTLMDHGKHIPDATAAGLQARAMEIRHCLRHQAE